MEETVSVDRQGRMVVPSHLRDALGIKDGGQVSIRLDGSRLIVDPIPLDIKEKTSQWVNIAMGAKAEAFVEKERENWKWMTDEYARRKLGLS